MDSTQLQFQAASTLDLLSTLSSSTSKVNPCGSPAPPAKEHTDLRSSTHAKNDADTLDDDTEDGITDEEAAAWKSSTSRCRSLSFRSVELLSFLIKCFCAACLDPQCGLVKCTICKITATMTDLTQFDASCLFEYTNWQVSTTGNEPSSETDLRMDLEETIEYASTLETTLRG